MFPLPEHQIIVTVGPWLVAFSLLLIVFAIGFGTGSRLRPQEKAVAWDPQVPLAPSAPTLVEGARAEAAAAYAELNSYYQQAQAQIIDLTAQLIWVEDRFATAERLRSKWHRLYKLYRSRWTLSAAARERAAAKAWAECSAAMFQSNPAAYGNPYTVRAQLEGEEA